MSTQDLASGRSSDQAQLRFLIDKNADGIIVVDGNGRVMFANPAAERLFGRPLGSLLGFAVGLPLVAGETAEISLHRPDGRQVEVEIRAVETNWEHRRAFLATLRDISARKAEEERLRHAAKMEAIGRLTAGIAHDFNNYLTVVLGNLQRLRRQLASDATALGSLDDAERGARQAAILTERLVAFARRKALEPRLLDVNELVSGMSDLLRRTLGETIRVRTALAPDVWDVEADPVELESAILNLAVNARDAMPDGGELFIETKNVDLDAAPASARDDLPSGPYVLIAMADTGTGMTRQVLDQAFEPFFTTKSDGRGTGLGLSHVYGFVKQSGGHVKLYSEPMIGTTVKVYLPRATQRRSAAVPRADAPAAADRIPGARPGETILVVEDNPDVRRYAAGSLRELGYSVFEAGDAESALVTLERGEHVDLLFTDLGLPGGMDGRTMSTRARAMRPSLKVLLTTAYAGSAVVHGGRLDAGVDLLSKPFNLSSLALRVRAVLDRRPERSDRRPCVLVVEDETLVRMVVVEALRDAGCHVEEAGTYREAAARITCLGAALDAAVVDVGLPDKPGDQLVDEIRAMPLQFPIILATGYGSAAQRPDRDVHLLSKPFQPQDLISALQSLGVQFQT